MARAHGECDHDGGENKLMVQWVPPNCRAARIVVVSRGPVRIVCKHALRPGEHNVGNGQPNHEKLVEALIARRCVEEGENTHGGAETNVSRLRSIVQTVAPEKHGQLVCQLHFVQQRAVKRVASDSHQGESLNEATQTFRGIRGCMTGCQCQE